MSHKKMIIDCDVGTDDAQAIMMALAYPDTVDVIAVTSVFGNATLEQTTRNALRVLTLCGRTDIPVYEGCASTMIGEPPIGNGYHGYDGLGDVPEPYKAANNAVQGENAVAALIRLTREHPGELTLVALGPLTNLATAMKLDPDFGRNLKEVYIMGGNTNGRGNMTPCAEFNFFSDPEAACLVVQHLAAPITLLPLTLCERFSFSWEWYAKFSGTDTEKAKFINAVEHHMVTNAKKANLPKYLCWDQLAMAAALDSDIITETQAVYITVELHGEHTRGQCVVDEHHLLKKPDNVRVVTAIDHLMYERMLYAAIENSRGTE